MKQIKLNNVIFPFWILLFFPPVIFISLLGNFIIDSLVVIACFFIFKLVNSQENLKAFYKKSILKVWIFGFLADFFGAALLFLINIFSDSLGLSSKLIQGINFDPFGYPLSIAVILFAMAVASLFIFIFNYNITFKKLIKEKALRLKVAVTIAIVTTPWTFLLPTKWFYHG